MSSSVLEILQNILQAAMKDRSSDIHFSTNKPPYLRMNGDILPIAGVSQLRADMINGIFRQLHDLRSGSNKAEDSFEKAMRVLETEGRYNFSLSTTLLGGEDIPKVRLRLCVVKDMEGLAIVARVLPDKIPELSELGFLPDHRMPERLCEVINRTEGGLILVTGPTGSGKTTTLASIINHINATQHKHVITVEDPIEIVYPQFLPTVADSNRWLALMRQRELHLSTPSFMDGCEDALRMDPDIILVGEIRNVETMRSVLYAAETGHLVFSTLHTKGGVKTINRIVSLFPSEEYSQVCRQLANNLVGILSQRLLRRANNQGRCLCYEWLDVTAAEGRVATALRTGKLDGILNAMVPANSVKWNDCLTGLLERGLITKNTEEAARLQEV